MATRANIVISDGSGTDRILYHHHDGDEIGLLLRDFIEHVPTGGQDDFAEFLKHYTNPDIGYLANEFKDAKVVNTDIDYIYFVIIYPEHHYGKVVEGYRFPHPPLSVFGDEVRASDGQLADYGIYDKFATSRDFTYARIKRYWRQSFYFVHGIPDDIIGGAPSPKEL